MSEMTTIWKTKAHEAILRLNQSGQSRKTKGVGHKHAFIKKVGMKNLLGRLEER